MRLREILDSVSDTYNFKENSNVIFLNTGDILSGKFLHSNYSESKFLPGQAKKSIKNNDILFSEIRPANQRFALVDVSNPEESRSGTFPQITFSEIQMLDIPELSLDEQKHIVDTKC